MFFHPHSTSTAPPVPFSALIIILRIEEGLYLDIAKLSHRPAVFFPARLSGTGGSRGQERGDPVHQELIYMQTPAPNPVFFFP